MENNCFLQLTDSQLQCNFKKEEILTLITEQLSNLSEVVVTIIIYQDENNSKQSVNYIAPDLPSEEQTILNYLYSEKWYSQQIPNAKLIKLDIPTKLLIYAYILPSQKNDLEYVLVITDRSFFFH